MSTVVFISQLVIIYLSISSMVWLPAWSSWHFMAILTLIWTIPLSYRLHSPVYYIIIYLDLIWYIFAWFFYPFTWILLHYNKIRNMFTSSKKERSSDILISTHFILQLNRSGICYRDLKQNSEIRYLTVSIFITFFNKMVSI